MNGTIKCLLLALAVALAVPTLAQEHHGGHGAGSFPEVCRSDMASSPPMHMGGDGMAAMLDHQKANMDGMAAMDRDMMQGMMKDDADVAFVCGMIAHHQGAIDMAQVELQYGDDAWSREMAQKIIDAQQREIADMTGWLKTNGK